LSNALLCEENFGETASASTGVKADVDFWFREEVCFIFLADFNPI